ncbi:ADP-ribosyl cyclase/cyclic ADP-ribose hydrolase 1-like [Pseudophryne corroboree]|uniref:ADP-ribosyl cyclase/cyclic ADP-ribose hydrolase 1-like n=1 Tax=Pseudophryne corroboree TaxID=495146 RepID=UPI0030820BA4
MYQWGDAGKYRPLWTGSILVLAVIILAPCVVSAHASSKKVTGQKEQVHKWKGPGTSQNLRNVIVGRCFHYMSMHPGIGQKNCFGIWEELTNAVYRKDPCNVTEEDYKNLVNVTGDIIPCDKTLLWSRTYDLVHRYTKATGNFMTLEDTFLGFLFTGLTWCGKSSTPGMNFKSCPAWNECDQNSISSFWKMASAIFARVSCGVVNVMLNGSTDGAIVRKESIFRTVEIPNMDPAKVSEVKLWVIDDIEGEDRNSCNSDSFLELKRYIEQHKLKYSCIDNYKPVQALQCVSSYDRAACNQCSYH